jgi:hypothetical protein
VRIQNTFTKPEDPEKFIYQIEQTDFDYGHKFSHILYMFTEIINTEVLRETGDVSKDPLGNPRGRYDEHSRKFSLSIKPKFNRPVGERNNS